MAGSVLTGATELPDGTWVRGRGLGQADPGGAAPDFGLYLGAGRLRRRYDADLVWPHEWIYWPDFFVPLRSRSAAGRIMRLHDRARAGENVEVACYGGNGRTGTVMACLAVLAGLAPDEAVAWTRSNYRSHAIEVSRQRRWVEWFARYLADAS